MPSRLGDLEKRLIVLGLAVEAPKKGSHWKVRAKDGRMFPLPAHNGRKSEISDVYVRSLAKFVGVSFEDLKG